MMNRFNIVACEGAGDCSFKQLIHSARPCGGSDAHCRMQKIN